MNAHDACEHLAHEASRLALALDFRGDDFIVRASARSGTVTAKLMLSPQWADDGALAVAACSVFEASAESLQSAAIEAIRSRVEMQAATEAILDALAHMPALVAA